MSNSMIIIGREYSERVKKKSFIITTLLMPVLMLLLAVLPSLIIAFSGSETKKFNIVDETGVIAGQIANSEELTFTPIDVPLDLAIRDRSVDGIIYIPADAINTNGSIKIYSTDGLSLPTESEISGKIDKAIETERLKRYDIANLDNILSEVKSNVSVQSVRINDNDEEQQSSSMVSFFLGEFLTFLLYMALLLYGQMVMTSIIEEKNNRVLELIVSSVKPTQLMLGKIVGIGLVALTQIVIWLVLILMISAFVLPAVIPSEIMAEVSALNGGTLDASASSVDIEMLQGLAILSNPMYVMELFVYLMLFLILGFLFYSAIYAAIGSAVDNIQDASQLQTFIIVPIMLGIVFGIQAATSPNSALALVTSLIPFTSPMVMLARIPFGIPFWQIAVSLLLLVAGVALMIWLAAKIYRVGIFMYGKKPTMKELIRWARYK